MSSKEDLLDWNDGVQAYDAGNYSAAINYFDKITSSVGARISFNLGMCYGAMGDPKEAINCFTVAVRADKFLAVAYFMRGFFQIQLRGYGKALQDYDNAANYMRGNALIDYKQLGMDFKLYYAEVMYNRGMVQHLMGRNDQAVQDLAMAAQAKMERDHDIIDQVLSSKRFEGPFTCPKNAIYRPPEQKLKNAQKVDYIKRDGARVVAATDRQDQYIGFKDAQIRRQINSNERDEPPPSRSASGRRSYDEEDVPKPPSSNATPRAAPAYPSKAAPTQAPVIPQSRPTATPIRNISSPPPGSNGPAGGSGGGGGGGGAKLKIKCHYKDTRIVMIEPDISIGEFFRRIQDKFDGQQLLIKYKDEDGDMVMLVDEEDLAMALATPDAKSSKIELWLYD